MGPPEVSADDRNAAAASNVAHGTDGKIDVDPDIDSRRRAVSLFKRRGNADDSDQADQADQADDLDEESTEEGDEPADDDASSAYGEQPGALPSRGERTAATQAAARLRERGPFDLSEVDDVSALLDLGSILVAPTDGMELRLELNEEDGEHVVGVTALIGESAVQVQAFAAPRNEGIWDEVRAEIAAGITQQGGTADEGEGTFGRELLARVPAQDPDGRSAFQPARFVGIDGPRWFLRGVFTGAAVEAAKAGAMEDLLRGLVVVRGQEAMAPRELLPLKLPEMAAPEVGAAPEDGPDDGAARSADDLNPFERGPEITEIR
jgi:hypothetical protein